MAVGRPSQGKQQRYPELEELALWFHRALADAGYRSVHEFLGRRPFAKNAVYGVFGATQLLTLDSTQDLAIALKRTAAQVRLFYTSDAADDPHGVACGGHRISNNKTTPIRANVPPNHYSARCLSPYNIGF